MKWACLQSETLICWTTLPMSVCSYIGKNTPIKDTVKNMLVPGRHVINIWIPGRHVPEFVYTTYLLPSSALGWGLLNLSVSKIFHLTKLPLRLFESRSYLRGATAAELRRHLSNINLMFNSWSLTKLEISENNGTEEIGLVTPTPGFVLVDLPLSITDISLAWHV